jgi:hypothetical protein
MKVTSITSVAECVKVPVLEVIELVDHDFQLLREVASDLVDLWLVLLGRHLSVRLLEVWCCPFSRKRFNFYALGGGLCGSGACSSVIRFII